MTEISFQFARYQDGILTIDIQPPTPVGSWDVEFYMMKRKGGTDKVLRKFGASGYLAGQSGITLVNSGVGIYNIDVQKVDTSGLEYGNYFVGFERTNSGFATNLAEGYITIK